MTHRCVRLILPVCLFLMASTGPPAKGIAAPVRLVDVSVDDLSSMPRREIGSDAHMEVVGKTSAKVADRVSYRSADGKFVLDVSAYDETTLRLIDWPVDEVMIFLEGRVEITDVAGHSRVYHAGESLIMPRGFDGVWRQLSPIKKIAAAYVGPAVAPAAVGLPTVGSSAGTIVLVTSAVLEGTKEQMKPIDSWPPFLRIVQPTRGRYIEVPSFHSKDGRLSVHVKRFEAATLALEDWPIDEVMSFLRGAVEITSVSGARKSYRAGDTMVIPKGFSGTWRATQTVDMLTIAYGES